MAKGICQVVYKVLILGVQNQKLKENLKWVAWGLDVGQEGPKQDKLLVFAFDLLSVIYFLLCKFFSLTLISLFEC